MISMFAHVVLEQDTHIEGAFGKEFVARGLCPELSLGYNVTMSKSPAGFLRASNKKVVEASLVRQGAREGCKIRAFTDPCPSSSSKRPRTSSSSSPSSSAPAAAAPTHELAAALPPPGRIHRILV